MVTFPCRLQMAITDLTDYIYSKLLKKMLLKKNWQQLLALSFYMEFTFDTAELVGADLMKR